MSIHQETATRIIAALAFVLGAGCGMDHPDAATPPPTSAAAPAKLGPLSSARLDALQTYDHDGDGVLDLGEKAQMEAARKARVTALKARINRSYDRNDNGVLEPAEEQALQADRSKLSVFKGAALRRYDANHNGVLDPDERQHMVTERQAFLQTAKGSLLARFDTNRDGKMDRQERAVMVHQLAPGTASTK